LADPARPRGFEAPEPRARRLRSPLLVSLWALLAFEALGGLTLFAARLIAGASPGEAAHVIAGVALTAVYAIYQFQHWRRVGPFRPQLHYALGLIAAIFMALVNLSGLWLAAFWWRERMGVAPVRYPALLSAAHNVASMVVLTFVLAHLGAVLFRSRER